MRSRTFQRISALVMLIASVAPVRAKAQTTQATPTAEDAAEGRKHAALGKKLLAMRLYEAAIPEFEDAYRRLGQAGDLGSIIDCNHALGNIDAEYAALQQMIARHGKNFGSHKRATFEQRVKEIETQTGLLVVGVSEDAATATLGARTLGAAPFAHPVRALAGTFVLRVVKPGFEPWVREVVVKAQETTTVSARLEAEITSGHLYVHESKAHPVNVVIDDKDVGPAPWDGDLAPGPHTLALKGPAFGAPVQTVQVTGRRQQSLEIEAHALTAHVQIKATPNDAIILVDGTYAGKGTVTGSVATGTHTIVIRRDGYKTFEKSIAVGEGETPEPFEIQLDPLVAKPTARVEDPYQGVYGGLTLGYAYPIITTPDVCAQSPGAATCSSDFPLAGLGALRLGYNTSVVGIEIVGAFIGSRRTQNVHYNAIAGAAGAAAIGHDETYTTLSLGGFGGVGPRILTHGRGVRFTIGVQGGVTMRYTSFARDLSNGLTDSTTTASTQFFPGAMADMALLIGQTPGAKFLIGPWGYVELPTSDVKTDAVLHGAMAGSSTVNLNIPAYTLVTGPQLFAGAMIGVIFGH